MIVVTRLNGPAFALNPDLIERAESTPDTVVTLVDGTKYVLAEPVEELVARIREYRASVLCASHVLGCGHDDECIDGDHRTEQRTAHRGEHRSASLSDVRSASSTVVRFPRRDG